MTRIVRIFFVLALALPLVSCGSRDEQDANKDDNPSSRSYRPVPDSELFAAVEKLPDVTSQTLYWKSDFASGDNYRGEVTLKPNLDEARVIKVFDRVITILRHGRADASYDAVDVRSGDTDISAVSLKLGFDQTYEQRYGPQTGEKGWPPPFVPN